MMEKLLSVILILLSVTLTESASDADIVLSEDLLYTECLTNVTEYPHDTSSFTQGLFFHNGELYESTGRYAESKIYKNVDIATGKPQKEYIFDDAIFAEGSVVFEDTLYVLTYKEEQVLVFDPDTLEHLTTYSYPRQGWGLTTDGEYLIASDGSEYLYFMDGELNTERKVRVKNNGSKVMNINELEYINGEIWANQWLTENILIIDPESGNVTRTIDLSGLYTPISDSADDVLNGIAYDKDSGKVYITGKCWDKLYEFEIIQ